MQTNEDVLLTRNKNNFNLLRLLAAVGVIITHSYALLGFAEKDWLTQITNGLLSFSRLGVYIFFIISGFLVANSLWNSSSVKSFFWKRFLRIFPALAVVLFLTTFVVGPLLTTSTLKEYFGRPGTYHYLIGGLSLYDTQYELSGVFKSNPRAGLNGSLWTLPYEWTCYVLLVCLMLPFKKRRLLGSAFMIIFLMGLRFLVGRYQIFQVIDFLKLDSRQLLLFGAFFFTGVLGLELRKYLKFRPVVSLLLVFALCCLSYINKNLSFYFVLLIVPYVTLSLAAAHLPQKIITFFSNIDYSYGLYIYAYLVGQILVNYFHKYLSVSYLAILTILCTLPLAALSWYLVEKQSLKFKKIRLGYKG